MILLQHIWMLCVLLNNFPLPSHASGLSIPLQRHRDHSSTLEHKLRAISKRASSLKSRNLYYTPIDFGPHDWWWGDFDVGESKNLSLVIDTASTTLYLNSGLYKPSNESIKFNRTSPDGYGTWFADGCGRGNTETDVFRDTVSVSSDPTLVVKNQSFGTLLENEPSWALPPFPRDGIMGMSLGTSFRFGAGVEKGWVVNLCDQDNTLEDCRFGMAMGTEGTGSLIFGGVDKTLFEGELTPTGKTIGNDTSYPWFANIVLNDTKILIPHKAIGLFDSGTSNILVPPEDARTIFNAAGIQHVQQPVGWGNCSVPVVVGYYPCDDAPTIGLHMLLSGSPVGTPMNIEPTAFALADNGNNNCTSMIIGHPTQVKSWTVGNAWMIGKYTDWSVWAQLQGVANLKDPNSPLKSSTSKNSSKNSATGLRMSISGIGMGFVAFLFSLMI